MMRFQDVLGQGGPWVALRRHMDARDLFALKRTSKAMNDLVTFKDWAFPEAKDEDEAVQFALNEVAGLPSIKLDKPMMCK